MKNQDKMFMAKDMGTSEIHGPLLGCPGPRLMYRLNSHLIGPVFRLDFGTVPTMWYILFSFYYCNFGEIEKKNALFEKCEK